MNYGKRNLQEEEQTLADMKSGSHFKPPAIQEVSEPASPDDTHPSSPTSRHVKPKRSNISEITRLLRTNSHSGEHEPLASKPPSSRGDSVTSDIPELVIDDADGPPDEQTPLLKKGTDDQAIHKTDWNGPGDLEGQPVRQRKGKLRGMQDFFGTVQHKGQSAFYTISHPKSWDAKVIYEKGIKEPVGLLPCVFLGVLLNVLDALSYGRT
jgi:SulP family sulfate permease